jgi:hypothetical protein
MTDNLYKIERKILYKELEPLFEALSSVRYAVVKGEVLSQQIYGVPDRRRSSDIDILIDKKNVKFLEEQLRKLGFEQKLPEDNAEIRRNRVLCMAYSHQIPSYHKDKFGFHLNVDVNYDIFWGEYEGKRCSIDEFLSDTVDMEIYGVTVKTLPIEKAFVQLILHHYKEMNSLYHLSQHNCIRTDLFMDIYAFLSNNCNELSVDRIQTLCDFYSINDYGYYMLFYVWHVFPDEMLHGYIDTLAKKANKQLLNCFGLNSLERKNWNISFAERLDSDNLKETVFKLITKEDKKKIDLNQTIFT